MCWYLCLFRERWWVADCAFGDKASEFNINTYMLFTTRPVADASPYLQQLFGLIESRRFFMRLGTMQVTMTQTRPYATVSFLLRRRTLIPALP